MSRKRNKIILAAALLVILISLCIVYTVRNRGTIADGAATDEAETGNGNGITVTRSDKFREAEDKELLKTYRAMKEYNPDFAGFVRIEGTELEYPVMYTPYEPEKYLHMDISGEYSDRGLPFIDARCDLEPESDNIIIYGHDMKDGSMFKSLIEYQDRSYFEKHPVICFDLVDEIREYEVMSVFYDRVYYEDEDVFKFYNFIKAAGEDEYREAVEHYLEKSLYDTGVRAQYGDRLITLVTCSYQTENGRFAVVARKKSM